LTLAAALLKRAATAATTLVLVTCIVFALVHATPGDLTPGAGSGDESPSVLSPERTREIRALYHLDEPLIRQYGLWIRDVLRGDLGRSFYDARPVVEKIGSRLPTTLALNAVSLALMIAISLPLGAFAAWKRGTGWDRLGGLVTYALFAVPVFWAALLLQLLFSVRLGWLPLFGVESPEAAGFGGATALLDRAAHLVLPVVCLSYTGLAYLSRFVRATLLEGAFDEAARAARARGVTTGALLLHHGLKRAAVPLLTLAGFLVPTLVGGSVIVETVFALPGIGRLFFDAVFDRDLPMVLGLTLLSGAATLAGIVLADVAASVADPRVTRPAPGSAAR